jgi:hypothetical protein
LACKAYVNLGLGEPNLALSAAMQLLEMPKQPGGLELLYNLFWFIGYVVLDLLPKYILLRHIYA